MNPVLLTLIATPRIQEPLLDWLLTHGYTGFTTLACHGHGTGAERLSASEQVAGRQERVAFWVQLPSDRATELLGGLRRDFAETGLHYWISPLIDSGRISASEDAP